MVLAAALVWRPLGNLQSRAEEERIGGLGILQLTWLLGRNIWIARDVAAGPPTNKDLRERGKKIVERFVDPVNLGRTITWDNGMHRRQVR